MRMPMLVRQLRRLAVAVDQQRDSATLSFTFASDCTESSIHNKGRVQNHPLVLLSLIPVSGVLHSQLHALISQINNFFWTWLRLHYLNIPLAGGNKYMKYKGIPRVHVILSLFFHWKINSRLLSSFPPFLSVLAQCLMGNIASLVTTGCHWPSCCRVKEV